MGGSKSGDRQEQHHDQRLVEKESGDASWSRLGGKRILRWGVWSSGGTSGVDPYGYQISSTRAIPGPRAMIVGQDDSYRWTSLTLTSFVMPNQDPETVKQWYVKNREAILKRKQQHPAAKKKQQQPRPKRPPSPKQTVRRKELNRQACNRYRDSHHEKVRAINRTYYHSNRERIVWQQRECGAKAKNPFRKLRALAQVCTEQLRSLYHVPTSQKIGQYRVRKKTAVDGMVDMKAINRQRYREKIAQLKAEGEYETFKKHKATVGERRYHNMSDDQRAEVCQKNPLCQKT